jgi:hypothetical protein
MINWSVLPRNCQHIPFFIKKFVKYPGKKQACMKKHQKQDINFVQYQSRPGKVLALDSW